MPAFRFVSPERRWRAASLVMLAALFSWRAFRYAGPGRQLAVVAAYLLPACLLACVLLVMRTCLVVGDDTVTDRRALRVVRLPWSEITGFRVARPGWMWGGFCVVAECRGGTEVDLLATRAYSRAPSARHLDELHRLCWTLEEHLARTTPST
jgi:PH (Pleckstrin Homology) domain-containing protein